MDEVGTSECAPRVGRTVPHGAGRTGGRFTRPELEVEAMMAHVAEGYASEHRRTKAAAYLALRERIGTRNGALPTGAPRLRMPSRQTFDRRISMLDPFRVRLAREGSTSAGRRLRPSTSAITPTRVGEVVVLSERQVHAPDLLVGTGLWDRLSDERKAGMAELPAWTCEAIDVASCAVLGKVITLTRQPTAVVEVLRMTMTDKGASPDLMGTASWPECAYPETIVTDAGLSLVQGDLREIVAGLGIRLTTGTAGRAIAGSGIGRWAAQASPWRGLAGGVRPSGIGKVDNVTDGSATFDVDDLCAVLVRLLVERHRNSPCAELCGETPAAAFRRLRELHGASALPNPTTMAMMFGP